MGQFFISDKIIRFDCDCENPYQPIVDKKAKSIKCKISFSLRLSRIQPTITPFIVIVLLRLVKTLCLW